MKERIPSYLRLSVDHIQSKRERLKSSNDRALRIQYHIQHRLLCELKKIGVRPKTMKEKKIVAGRKASNLKASYSF